MCAFQGTFDYGKQLLSAALVLRRSGRYDTSNNHEMMEELINIWEKFDAGIQERGDRLALAEKFHTVADKVCVQIQIMLALLLVYT